MAKKKTKRAAKKATKKKAVAKKRPVRKKKKGINQETRSGTVASARTEDLLPGVLTDDQLRKIRKLVKSKEATNVEMAVQLLQSAEATSDNWSDVFSSKTISLMVNTWDIAVWNEVAAGLEAYPNLYNEFSNLAAARYDELGPHRKRFSGLGHFIGSALTLANIPVVSMILNLVIKRTLPPKSMQYYGTFEIGLGPNGITSLSEGGLRIATEYQGRLVLGGLTSLSEEESSLLGQRKGYLSLNGLTEVSESQIDYFSKHEGGLGLNGLSELTDTSAERLSKHGGKLFLNGLVELSDRAIASLSRHDPEKLKFSQISDEHWQKCIVSEFSGGVGDSRHPNDVQRDIVLLNPDGSIWEGNTASLSLNGLQSLSAKAAKSLSTYKGKLSLTGLAQLCDNAAQYLAKQANLSINLGNLPASAAKILRDAGHGE
jgi:hypothetical protein